MPTEGETLTPNLKFFNESRSFHAFSRPYGSIFPKNRPRPYRESAAFVTAYGMITEIQFVSSGNHPHLHGVI